jgi:hypothetical protein
MATTHEVIRVSNNHYPRVEHYTFSTTMVSLLDKLKLTFQTNVLQLLLLDTIALKFAMGLDKLVSNEPCYLIKKH